MDNWYYVGHFGQLGPLQRSEIDELIISGAITHETYVWREGMSDWVRAASLPELVPMFPTPPTQVVTPSATPPPTPTGALSSVREPPQRFQSDLPYPMQTGGKSRVLAGVLQLFLAGVGRMYAGYVGLGIAQLLLTIFTCGFAGIWSFVDGIVILAGGVRTDGEGRPFSD